MGKKHDDFNKLKEVKIKPEKEVKTDTKNKLIVIMNYLKDKYDFRYNVINTDFEYKKKDETEYKYFDDMDYRDVLLDTQMNCGIAVSDQNFKNIVYSSSICTKYNPFREYLLNLPKWDGETDFIKLFLQQVYLMKESDRDYFINGFKKWFAALVVSLVEDEPSPFYINQTCLILVGAQGRYKTTFLKSIIPKHLQLKYFYSSTFQVHNKDHEKYLAYKIVVNLDELAVLNKTDIESLKRVFTQDQIVIRLPYARADIHLKRRASFCGSINNVEFLRDDTGSRRWFIVEIDKIDLREDVEMDGMYAQALHLYKTGFKYWFDATDIMLNEAHNEQFKLKTMEEELLLKHFDVPENIDITAGANIEYLSATDIANHFAEKYTKINVNNTVVKNIGSLLKKLGYQKVKRRLNNYPYPIALWAVKRVYEPQNVSADEIVKQEEFPI